ncbi:MAG: glutamate synthase subunit beta [Polyangiaceae bacterium]
MGKTTGFLEFQREEIAKRPAAERVSDWREFELPVLNEQVVRQGARCMDCGIPFCNTGCPLGNLIPDWNDLAYKNDLGTAVVSLHSTNNFPEITGRVCPAPCEAACVLGINQPPVSIKQIEHVVGDHAIANNLIVPLPAQVKTGKKVAVIGSGPAGLAAAQQLARAGHEVTVYEKDDRVGGLLVYGIPDFKLSKEIIARRADQMQGEGVTFVTNCKVGEDVTLEELRKKFNAICVAIGSKVPRDLPVEGRNLAGIHFAMDFLEQQNRRVAGQTVAADKEITATGKRVVVIGGGDTGSDCIGTSHRQKAISVTNFEIMPKPPETRSASTPWPNWPLMLRTSSSHDEGGLRDFAVMTERFEGKDGHVSAVHCVRVKFENGQPLKIPGSEFVVEADLVLLAMGFVHPEPKGLLAQLGAKLDARGNLQIDQNTMTSVDGVFAAGDCQRGQSLVVWAIADGRRAARGIDAYLMGQSEL